MLRFRALALAAAPLALAAVAPAPIAAQADAGLPQVQAHLRAVDTMTANFTQTDRRGRSLNGTLTSSGPGKIRFDYGRSANMLIVGDGRALTFVDYDVGAACSAGRSTIRRSRCCSIPARTSAASPGSSGTTLRC